MNPGQEKTCVCRYVRSEFIHWALWRTLMRTNFFVCSSQAFWLSSAPGVLGTLLTSVILYSLTQAILMSWVLGRMKHVYVDIQTKLPLHKKKPGKNAHIHNICIYLYMYIYNLSICICIPVYLPICYNHGTEKNQKLNLTNLMKDSFTRFLKAVFVNLGFNFWL